MSFVHADMRTSLLENVPPMWNGDFSVWLHIIDDIRQQNSPL